VSLVADEVISKPSETSCFPIKPVYIRFSPTDERSVSYRYHLPRLHQLYNVCIAWQFAKEQAQETRLMWELQNSGYSTRLPFIRVFWYRPSSKRFKTKRFRTLGVFGNTVQVMTLDIFYTLNVLCPTKRQGNRIRMVLKIQAF
jgi:hypothetical protein